MIKHENECVGCPPEMGCIGMSCPNRSVPHYYCDICGEELDEYWNIDGSIVCRDCLNKMFNYQCVY